MKITKNLITFSGDIENKCLIQCHIISLTANAKLFSIELVGEANIKIINTQIMELLRQAILRHTFPGQDSYTTFGLTTLQQEQFFENRITQITQNNTKNKIRNPRKWMVMFGLNPFFGGNMPQLAQNTTQSHQQLYSKASRMMISRIIVNTVTFMERHREDYMHYFPANIRDCRIKPKKSKQLVINNARQEFFQHCRKQWQNKDQILHFIKNVIYGRSCKITFDDNNDFFFECDDGMSFTLEWHFLKLNQDRLLWGIVLQCGESFDIIGELLGMCKDTNNKIIVRLSDMNYLSQREHQEVFEFQLAGKMNEDVEVMYVVKTIDVLALSTYSTVVQQFMWNNIDDKNSIEFIRKHLQERYYKWFDAEQQTIQMISCLEANKHVFENRKDIKFVLSMRNMFSVNLIGEALTCQLAINKYNIHPNYMVRVVKRLHEMLEKTECVQNSDGECQEAIINLSFNSKKIEFDRDAGNVSLPIDQIPFFILCAQLSSHEHFFSKTRVSFVNTNVIYDGVPDDLLALHIELGFDSRLANLEVFLERKQKVKYEKWLETHRRTHILLFSEQQSPSKGFLYQIQRALTRDRLGPKIKRRLKNRNMSSKNVVLFITGTMFNGLNLGDIAFKRADLTQGRSFNDAITEGSQPLDHNHITSLFEPWVSGANLRTFFADGRRQN